MSSSERTLAGGRYSLHDTVGSGGMATVYRGFDHRLQVNRAVKVLAPSYAEHARVRARFEAEARMMAVLDHPNIVRVYDVGSNEETAWIVMELIDGGSLLERVEREGSLNVEEALDVASAVLTGLAVAHEHGVVHRDIKPHNILIGSDGLVRITDFGIARSVGLTDDSFTKTGTVMGTWAFMAPEQRVDAKGVDHTADIYGVGASLFAMVTRRTPMDLFASDLDPEMLVGVPDAIIPLIRKATRYQREERYSDANEMLEHVARVRSQISQKEQTVRTPGASKVDPIPANPAPQAGEKSNDTYVPDELNGELHHTPTPFRPNSVDNPSPPAPPAATPEEEPPPKRRSRKRRIHPGQVIVAILIIVGLTLGGSYKRFKSALMSEPGDTTELTANPSADLVLDPVQVVESQPTPEPRPAPIVQTSPPETITSAPIVETVSPPVPTIVPPPTEAPSASVPSIQHAPPTSARMGTTMMLTAKLDGVKPVDIRRYVLKVYQRAQGVDAYGEIPMVRTSLTWSAPVRIDIQAENGVEYFIKAAPDGSPGRTLTALQSGEYRTPHHVRVTSP